MEFGREQLPSDFWDNEDAAAPAEPPIPAPAATERSPATPTADQPPQFSPGAPAAAVAADDAAGELDAATEAASPTELEEAFNQLQSLFPGRVVEVLPPETDDAAQGTQPAPLEDAPEFEDGYDEDDQDRLPFGPRSA